MKKLSLTLAFAIISVFAFSQIGFRAGLNYSSISISTEDESEDLIKYKSNIGFQAGIDYELGLTENLFFNPAFLYSQKGSKMEVSFLGESAEGKMIFNYIELPLDFVYKFGSDDLKFGVFAGPYVGYWLSGKSEFDGEEEEIEGEDVNKIDFGAEFGAGVYFNKLNLRVYYSLGLSNIVKDVEEGEFLKNKGLGLTVGYRL